MATPTPTPKLVDRTALDTELKNFFEAREKTEAMAREAETERAKAEVELVQEAAREIATGQPSPDAVADRVKRWQGENKLKEEKIDALELLRKKVDKRLDDIKKKHRVEARQWLKRQIDALAEQEDEEEAKKRQTAARVKALREELKTIQPPKEGKRKRKPKAKAKPLGKAAKGAK